MWHVLFRRDRTFSEFIPGGATEVLERLPPVLREGGGGTRSSVGEEVQGGDVAQPTWETQVRNKQKKLRSWSWRRHMDFNDDMMCLLKVLEKVFDCYDSILVLYSLVQTYSSLFAGSCCTGMICHINVLVCNWYDISNVLAWYLIW